MCSSLQPGIWILKQRALLDNGSWAGGGPGGVGGPGSVATSKSSTVIVLRPVIAVMDDGATGCGGEVATSTSWERQ